MAAEDKMVEAGVELKTGEREDNNVKKVEKLDKIPQELDERARGDLLS